MTPIEYLDAKGIDLNTTCVLTVVDGYMRQPDICQMLQEFSDINNNPPEEYPKLDMDLLF